MESKEAKHFSFQFDEVVKLLIIYANEKNNTTYQNIESHNLNINIDKKTIELIIVLPNESKKLNVIKGDKDDN